MKRKEDTRLQWMYRKFVCVFALLVADFAILWSAYGLYTMRIYWAVALVCCLGLINSFIAYAILTTEY